MNFFTPLIFGFEMIIVLPNFYEPGSFLYMLSILLSLFLFFQIEGNYLACLIVDTSVDYENLILPWEDKKKLESIGWHECEACLQFAPPRSWHCSACETCILKRDHHSLFTGACVGHYNQRYFIMFLIYMFIGSSCAFVYNSTLLWLLSPQIFNNVFSFLKVICPFMIIATNNLWYMVFLIFYNMNVFALFYSVALLAFHGPGLINGEVCYERNKNFPYNKRSWRRNFETVFGKRMHLVWLSPLVKSELPDDGINWELPSAVKPEKIKRYKKRKEK